MNTELEKLILANSLKNSSFLKKVAPYLTHKKDEASSFEDPKHNLVLKLINSFIEKKHHIPTKETLMDMVYKLDYDQEVNVYIKNIVDYIYELSEKDLDTDYIEEESNKLIKRNTFQELYIKHYDEIIDGNFQGFKSDLSENIQEDYFNTTDIGTDVIESNKIYEEIENLVNRDVVSTGYSSLDNAIAGGFFKRELTVFGAISGLGKTMFLLNFAINAMLEGKNVVFYTMETSTIRLWQRFITNLLDIDSKKILIDQDTVKTQLDDYMETVDGSLIIKEYNANEINSADIEEHLKKVEEVKDISVDAIYVDYLLLIKSNDNRLSVENSYKYYKTVSEELRNIAKTKDIPVVTAIQLNRDAYATDGASKQNLSSKNTSESMGVIHTSENVVLMSQSNSDKEKNQVVLKTEKVRNGTNNTILSAKINYDKQRITNISEIR